MIWLNIGALGVGAIVALTWCCQSRELQKSLPVTPERIAFPSVEPELLTQDLKDELIKVAKGLRPADTDPGLGWSLDVNDTHVIAWWRFASGELDVVPSPEGAEWYTGVLVCARLSTPDGKRLWILAFLGDDPREGDPRLRVFYQHSRQEYSAKVLRWRPTTTDAVDFCRVQNYWPMVGRMDKRGFQVEYTRAYYLAGAIDPVAWRRAFGTAMPEMRLQ